MPDALASFPSQSVGSVFLSAVDLAAALAPVPWLHPAAQLVGRIVLLCQNVPKNKYGNRFLNDLYTLMCFYIGMQLDNSAGVVKVYYWTSRLRMVEQILIESN